MKTTALAGPGEAGPLLELRPPPAVAHDEAGRVAAAGTQPGGGLDEELLALARVVEVADVPEDEAVQPQARTQLRIRRAGRELLRVHPVGDDEHPLGRDPAGHDVLAHRLGDRHDGVGRGHHPRVGGVPPPGDLGVLRPGAAAPGGLEERADVVDERQAVVLPERQAHEGDVAAAQPRRGVEDRRPLGADDAGGEPGEVLQVAVEGDVGGVGGAEVQAMDARPLHRLHGGRDPAGRPGEAEGGDGERVEPRPAQGGHRVVAAEGEAGLAVGQQFLEDVEDPARRGRLDRLGGTRDARQPQGVALAQHPHQPAVQVGPLRCVPDPPQLAEGGQAGRRLARSQERHVADLVGGDGARVGCQDLAGDGDGVRGTILVEGPPGLHQQARVQRRLALPGPPRFGRPARDQVLHRAPDGERGGVPRGGQEADGAADRASHRRG